jgi:hypothetical protein
MVVAFREVRAVIRVLQALNATLPAATRGWQVRERQRQRRCTEATFDQPVPDYTSDGTDQTDGTKQQDAVHGWILLLMNGKTETVQ